MSQDPLPNRARLVPRGKRNSPAVRIVGHRRPFFGDLYAHLMPRPAWQIALIMFLFYLTLNLAFTLAYLVTGAGIEHARPGNFADAFFFSVQTLVTIGYGTFAPQGTVANILVIVEAFCGISFYAVLTGVFFSKFSQPRARFLFSRTAIISDQEGAPHFMMRLANQRANRIVNAEVKLMMLKTVISAEGHIMRRFFDMKLHRTNVPFLQLTWLVMHPIDEESPLRGLGIADLRECDAEIIVSISGLDETFGQIVHARYSYVADEIAMGAAFEDILLREDDGTTVVRYDRFHKLKTAPTSEGGHA